jgi:hypothetical protein
MTESGIAFRPECKKIIQNDQPDLVAVYPILLQEARQQKTSAHDHPENRVF